MARSILFALLTASSALFTLVSAAPSSDYSGGLVYRREVNFGHEVNWAETPTTHNARTLERRAGLVPHVPSANIVLSPNGGAYPRVTSLSDGSLLAVYTASSGGNKTLTVARSTDGGSTFGAWGTIATSPGDLDNGFLLQLPNGNVVAAFRNHDMSGSAYTYYRLTACVSTDGGRTWTFLSQIDQRAATATNNGLWEPFLRLSSSSALQVYYASENSGNDQDILVQTSTDNGATWSGTTTVAGATTTGRDGMPGCAQFHDGATKLMCVFETTEGHSGLFSVKSVVSTDDGKTWGTTRSEVFNPSGSNNNAGAPQLVATSDGNLVVSFMTDEDTSAHSWPKSGVAFKIVTGPPVATGNWGHKTTVTGPQSAWPGLYAKSDGSVLGCAGAPAGLICKDITFTTS
ncbi:neuraminidase [Dichomitus squalens LYAD-421 SS1]|uniref:Neuraminidase n=1 Tax=Dichomitus squalens TaxID=114155 RepID=A0A4Q9QD48_9APHY|nr:neuraminidase [Dichomitus squalens LYAD-421 SS1]EJF66027.1 neuraminidase [Dichomitus squalens LYAD-421 SS1]TBU65629.1 neuraminidase [Dichomitus squalens]